MNKRCKITGAEFEITNEDSNYYEKIGANSPSLSPQERQRNRTGFRNFRNLYHRACSATGKRIISMYDESVGFPVYENSYWWSDAWDAQSYQQDLNFNQPFFEQYKVLENKEVIIEDFQNKEIAYKIIREAIDLYQEKFVKNANK